MCNCQKSRNYQEIIEERTIGFVNWLKENFEVDRDIDICLCGLHDNGSEIQTVKRLEDGDIHIIIDKHVDRSCICGHVYGERGFTNLQVDFTGNKIQFFDANLVGVVKPIILSAQDIVINKEKTYQAIKSWVFGSNVRVKRTKVKMTIISVEQVAKNIFIAKSNTGSMFLAI